MGTCIGKRNYRFFVTFIYGVTVLCLCGIGISTWHLASLAMKSASTSTGEKVLDALRQSPIRFVSKLFFSRLSVG